MSDSRSALLAAAAEEFARHGLRGTRVQSIVKRAGVNERMIYHHFGSKDGLYRAVLEDERRRIGEAWSPHLEKTVGLEPYQAMREVLAAFFDIMTARPVLVALLTHEWLAGSLVTAMPTADQLPARVRDIYERGRREGVFERTRPFEMAYGVTIGSLVGLSVFLPQFHAAVDWSADPAKYRELVVGQLVDGLTGPHRTG